MGAKYTEAQAEASRKHHAKLDNITVRVPKGEKANLNNFIREKTNYKSMNKFVVDAIEYYKKIVNEDKIEEK